MTKKSVSIPSPSPINPPILSPAEYVSHDDGDTGKFVSNNFDIVIRLARIDAPELPHSAFERALTTPEALSQFKWGEAARKAIEDKIKAVGRSVTCVKYGFDSQYNRNICTVQFSDGVDWGTFLVSQGLALVYTQYAQFGLDYSELMHLQDNAKTQGLGFWSDPAFTEPWTFRKKVKFKALVEPKDSSSDK